MKFRITDRVNSFFTQCKAEDKLPDDLVIEIDSAVKKGYITVNLLTKINKNLKCDDSVDIKDLLKGSSLIFVDNKPKIEASHIMNFAMFNYRKRNPYLRVYNRSLQKL